MKVEANEIVATFTPIEVKITLTSLEEIRELYSIFNSIKIIDSLAYIDHRSIRTSLRDINKDFCSDSILL